MPNINDSFPSNYLKASDLKGRTIAVEIDRLEFEPVGQKREMKPILYFAGKEKGLVLNKTNANKIIALLGTEETDNWSGEQIAIYPTETSFQGDMVDCIRVKAARSNGNGHARVTKPEPVAPPDYPVEHALSDDDIPF